jgi:hypothetical protein
MSYSTHGCATEKTVPTETRIAIPDCHPKKQTLSLQAHLELSELDDLVGGKVDLHGVVGLDKGIRETDGAAIVCNDVGNALVASVKGLYLAQLVCGLLGLFDMAYA